MGLWVVIPARPYRHLHRHRHASLAKPAYGPQRRNAVIRMQSEELELDDEGARHLHRQLVVLV